jgi:hypothetical protein
MASTSASIYFVYKGADVSLAKGITTLNAPYAETVHEVEECHPCMGFEE